MLYPAPPWTLRGFAMQTLQPIDIDRARLYVPSELEIVSFFPGKTLGGIYVSTYGTGSALQYSELIVVSAFTRQDNRFGAWISHIYVDNPDSVAGGREIWGLPKELADFEWQIGKPHCVTVRQQGQLLCKFEATWQLPGVPVPFAIGSFSQSAQNLLWFLAESRLRLSAISTTVVVPPESAFYSLGLHQPWLSFYGDELNLQVGAPIALGQTSRWR